MGFCNRSKKLAAAGYRGASLGASSAREKVFSENECATLTYINAASTRRERGIGVRSDGEPASAIAACRDGRRRTAAAISGIGKMKARPVSRRTAACRRASRRPAVALAILILDAPFSTLELHGDDSPIIARKLRRGRPRPHGRWHLDEVFVSLNGKQLYVWRAVDSEGEVLDILIQPRRDRKVAFKLMRKLLKKQGITPAGIVTLTNSRRGKASSLPSSRRKIIIHHPYHDSCNTAGS